MDYHISKGLHDYKMGKLPQLLLSQLDRVWLALTFQSFKVDQPLSTSESMIGFRHTALANNFMWSAAWNQDLLLTPGLALTLSCFL